jgi:hypothetical protein
MSKTQSVLRRRLRCELGAELSCHGAMLVEISGLCGLCRTPQCLHDSEGQQQFPTAIHTYITAYCGLPTPKAPPFCTHLTHKLPINDSIEFSQALAWRARVGRICSCCMKIGIFLLTHEYVSVSGGGWIGAAIRQ